MNLSQSLDLVEAYLGTGDLPESGDRLTKSSAIAAINRGYVSVAVDLACFSRRATIAAANSTSVYSLPVDMFKLEQVWFDGTQLTATDQWSLDLDNGDWRSEAASTPAYWLLQNSLSLTIYPAPSSGTGKNITVEGKIVPTDVVGLGTGSIPFLANDIDMPQLPFAFHAMPAYWAVAYLAQHVLAGDPMAAQSGQIAFGEYQSLVANYRDAQIIVGGYDGRNTSYGL